MEEVQPLARNAVFRFLVLFFLAAACVSLGQIESCAYSQRTSEIDRLGTAGVRPGVHPEEALVSSHLFPAAITEQLDATPFARIPHEGMSALPSIRTHVSNVLLQRIVWGYEDGIAGIQPRDPLLPLARELPVGPHMRPESLTTAQAGGDGKPDVTAPLDTNEEGVDETVKTPKIEVCGYYPIDYEGDRVSYRSLEAYHEHLDQVAVFNHPIDAGGRIGGHADPALMDLARRTGTKVLALVHNMRNGAFDRQAAHAVLSDATIRSRAVESVFDLLSQQGYSGVNIDLENVAPADSSGYTSFIKELSERLHPEGYLVTVSIPAKTADDPNHGWSGAFDYKSIGEYADQVMIMTYDEHWTGSQPGPVASLNWVEKVVGYAVTRIPPSKVFMGIAAYGYDWPERGRGRALSASKAASNANARTAAIRWDNTAQVPTYTYYQGSNRRIVYFENADSTALKLDMAQGYGLRGVAIWRLGFEDPGIWSTIRKKRI